MSDAEITRRVVWLTRLLGAGGLALMGVTWKLWTPQDVFPRVPLFWWAPPHWLDWSALAVTVFGLASLLFTASRRERFVAAALTAVGFALLFLSDQHRLQPWAWQFFILATVLALGDDRTVFYGWRWLVVSIYVWSALSKFDMAFVDGTGARLVEALEQAIHATGLQNVPGAGRLKWFYQWNALMFPLGELVVAVLLMRPAWMRWGCVASIAMHIGLLLFLGPLGLNHSLGVLAWNVFFIVQNAWLFWSQLPRFSDAALGRTACDDSQLALPFASWFARGLLAFVLLWPATEPWGWCDAWLGWVVYVPRSREVIIVAEVPEGTFRADAWEMPNGVGNQILREWSDHGADGTNIRIGRWSIEALAVPAYPNHRFQIGVALDLVERGARVTNVMVYEQRSRASRGQQYEFYTDHDRFESVAALRTYARTFRLNAFPESYYRRLEAERRGQQ